MNRTNDFRFTLVLLAFLACAVAAQAQRRNARYVEYIENYIRNRFFLDQICDLQNPCWFYS